MQANLSELNTPPQVDSSLAERIRWLLKSLGMEQQQLAIVMGVKLDRVKSLVLGRAKTLRSDEMRRLRLAHQIREQWLMHGELPVRAAPDRGSAPRPPAREATEQAAPSYVTRPSDVELLQAAVAVGEESLQERGLELPNPQRLRFYWALFELSLPAGQVNRQAVGPLLALLKPQN